MALLSNKGNRFSSTRRGLWALIGALLIVYAWLYFTHAAILTGIKPREMDWNNDGVATTREFFQSFYAVEANVKTDGPRTCTSFQWHGGATIKVECKTEFGKK